MFDREDAVFRDALERVYRRILWGDNETPGLHQALRASQSWEIFQRNAGRIDGVELAINEMIALAHRMSGDEPVPSHLGRVN